MTGLLATESSSATDARLDAVRRVAIVPAFNEAHSVADVIQEIRASDPGFAVLVIDDGSRDATAAVAHRAGATVVRLPFNIGIGGAVQIGYRYALENGYDVAVQVDGDGQHDTREIGRLLTPILDGEVDMVVGTRWHGGSDYRAPLSRRIGIALFAADYPADYPEVESTVLLFRHDLRMAEVPVAMRGRASGSSSITWFRSIYYVVKVTLALFIGLFRKPVTIPEDL